MRRSLVVAKVVLLEQKEISKCRMTKIKYAGVAQWQSSSFVMSRSLIVRKVVSLEQGKFPSAEWQKLNMLPWLRGRAAHS